MEHDNDKLKMRVLEAKKLLPRNYTSFFVFLFPEYDNAAGKQKLRNVYNLMATDEVITEKLEKLATNLAMMKGKDKGKTKTKTVKA